MKHEDTIASTATTVTAASTATVDLRAIGMDKKCARCASRKASLCCRSINQKIPAPRSREDFDFLLWQVSHEHVNLFKDEDGWFLHIMSPCSHLEPSGACGIYDRRPWVCREYDNDFCEYDESIPQGSELYFSTHAELEKYCETRFKRWKHRFEDYE